MSQQLSVSPDSFPTTTPECPPANLVTVFNTSRKHHHLGIPGTLSADPYTPAFRDGSPSPETRARPKLWLFRISPENLLGNCPKGAGTVGRLRNLNPGYYLGLVTSTFAQFDDDTLAIAEDIVVHFVAKDIPPVSEHYMPIFPANESEIWGRGELHTTVLFPLRGYKQWTNFGVRLRVQQVHHSSLLFELEHEEFARFEHYAGIDYRDLDLMEPQLEEGNRNLISKLLVSTHTLPSEIWN
ncbi:hypothetical protein BJ138DRAFT_1141766 [Hygrophoropsis aurantiaca]|uniref:Uncharacterized protein n=1 Tax=Hygrophoropsis aurantiaca TaxID=72124 RepID=A0ACB8AQI2_9AGAM|nr:hypothetical protein BJ138DRAFT_1141766 [Hygrophoropsis aurantiaca]